MSANASIKRRQPPAEIPAALSGHHPVIARILALRGVASEEALDMSLQGLIPPTDLPDIEPATETISEVIREGGTILIAGDYDADGATATSISLSALKAMGAKDVHFTIPDRQRHGYGLSPGLLEDWKNEHGKVPDLVLTVDNGVSAHEGVEAAKAMGSKVVVTDHHLPGETLPEAHAMVNPNIDGATFPSKAIAGCGVAFYVMLATRAKLDEQGWFTDARPKPNLAKLLDLVALGTIADVVPIDANNRKLVMAGLKRIRSDQCRPGIAAIFESANRLRQFAKSMDLGFVTGPRLNAAGRISHMKLGVECLLAEDPTDAAGKAKILEETNAQRKEIEQEMLASAGGQTADQVDGGPRPEDPADWIVYEPTYHQGVIGIVAGRLKEQWVRPVIVFAPNDVEDVDRPEAVIKGSGRSVDGVHLRDLLAEVEAAHPGVMLGFGGHAAAAGMSIRIGDLDKFRAAFREIANRHQGKFVDQVTIESDGGLSPNELSIQLAREIEANFPWGTAFPEPVFDNEFVVESRRELSGGKHSKLTVRPLDENGAPIGQPLEAIWFNIGSGVPSDDRVHLAYSLGINRFRGKETLQLMVQAGESAPAPKANARSSPKRGIAAIADGKASKKKSSAGAGKGGNAQGGEKSTNMWSERRTERSRPVPEVSTEVSPEEQAAKSEEDDALGVALQIAKEKKGELNLG